MEVGQKVYLKNKHYNNSNKITEAQISKIGRKYFYIGPHCELKFNINTLVEDNSPHSPRWSIYLSMKDVEDEEERNFLVREMDRYNFNLLTLEQLRQIKRIIDGGEEVE